MIITPQNRTFRESGFTLMEMLLVLGIIAMLVGMGTYMMKNVLGDAEVGKAKGDIQALSASLLRYRTHGGVYPTTQQGLEALVSRPTQGPQPPNGWKQYLTSDKALMDPWGTPYFYLRPGKYNPETYDVYSAGPDMEEGTEDDIGNW